MKTKEELKELKHDFESLASKLSELSEDEIIEITGGGTVFDIDDGQTIHEYHMYKNTVDDIKDFEKKF